MKKKIEASSTDFFSFKINSQLIENAVITWSFSCFYKFLLRRELGKCCYIFFRLFLKFSSVVNFLFKGVKRTYMNENGKLYLYVRII